MVFPHVVTERKISPIGSFGSTLGEVVEPLESAGLAKEVCNWEPSMRI